MYSAREFTPVEAQLPVLASVGYRNVEPFAALFDNAPAYRMMLDANGLTAISGHFNLKDIKRDPATAISIARQLASKL
jgi:hypothetical protein